MMMMRKGKIRFLMCFDQKTEESFQLRCDKMRPLWQLTMLGERYEDYGQYVPVLADKGRLCRIYDDHVEQVKKTVPADRLLVFKLGDGWEPLCKFLGTEIPNIPFPNANAAEEFKDFFLGSFGEGQQNTVADSTVSA